MGTLATNNTETRMMSFVKSVSIWSYSGPYFPVFGLNAKRYRVFSPNSEKYGPE